MRLLLILQITPDLYDWCRISDNRLQLYRIIIYVMSTQRQTNYCILVQFCVLLGKLQTSKKHFVNGMSGYLERLNHVKFQFIELSYKLVGRYQCFRRVCCLLFQGRTLKVEMADSSKILLLMYHTARCHIPEGFNLKFMLLPYILR
jgi:hypothetical protein